MLLNPFDQGVPLEVPGCKLQHELFLLVHRRTELMSVQQQKHLYGRMADAFVAIDKGMVEDKRKTEGCSFGCQVWIEVLS